MGSTVGLGVGRLISVCEILMAIMSPDLLRPKLYRWTGVELSRESVGNENSKDAQGDSIDDHVYKVLKD